MMLAPVFTTMCEDIGHVKREFPGSAGRDSQLVLRDNY